MDPKEQIKIAGNTAIISGVFCILISLLLLLNYTQMKRSAPLESMSLEILVDRLSMEPNNEELKEEIRSMDLLARKAYFTSLWQVKTGGWLLLFASIILIISLRIKNSLTSGIDKPEDEEEDEIKTRLISQKWIMAGGALLIVPAIIVAFTSKDPLEKYGTAPPPAEQETEQIPQVRVADMPDSRTTSDEQDESPSEDGMLSEVLPDRPSDEQSATPAESQTAAVNFPTDQMIMQNHNAFRGPFGNPVNLQRNLPLEWDGASGENILWKTEVPLHAFNSPVIWGDKLFLAGAESNSREVFCYNRHTGNLIWRQPVSNIPGSPASPPRTTEDTGLAAPSVTTNGIGVYAIFGTGDIIAFDMDGNRLWARNLGVPDNHYGHSSSLLSYREKLFVQYDDRTRGRIMCLNVLTGENIWDITRESDISWASPILANISGKYQLIVSGNPIVAGYDIDTGRELWTVSAMSGEVGPSPAYGSGLVFAANEYASMVAINPVNGTTVWQDNYYLPEVSSPAEGNGLLFIATTFAVVACFDALTGEFLWEFDADGIFYSSPLIADGKMWITDTGGVTYVFGLDREPNLIARSSLGEDVYTIPAFSDGRIYIRGEKFLYCIGN